MVRWLYILGICMLLAAGGVLGLWLSERHRVDREIADLLNGPGAVQSFNVRGGVLGVCTIENPALVIVRGESLSPRGADSGPVIGIGY
jgi:hypothetical protein